MKESLKKIKDLLSESAKINHIRRVNEMTAAGVAGGAPDATSQGPLVWADHGAGVMKTSPFGRVKFGRKKKKLKEGSQFGGYGATTSGTQNSGTFQGHTDNLEKKIKFKIKQQELEDKEENEKK